MELCLNWEELNDYEPVGPIAITGEEAVELPIPEYCPDVTRIVDAAGKVQIREKLAADGRVLLRGSVKVTVLYTSEESGGLRSVDLSVPFTSQTEEKRLQDCRTVWVEERLLLCEARVVTGRKLYIRVMPEFVLTGFVPQQRKLCKNAEGEGICQRHSEIPLQMLTAVEEREFTFSQELKPESQEDCPEEVLAERMTLQIHSSQPVGNRLVVKGEAQVSVLYRSEGQKLCCFRQSFPVSQIIDGVPFCEGITFQLAERLRECEVRMLRTDLGSSFALSARVVLLICGHQERTISCVTDLYSTSHRSRLKREKLSVLTGYGHQMLQNTVRENWELGNAPFAWLFAADCGPVQMTVEGDGVRLQGTLHLQILYLDESNTPISMDRSVEVSVSSARIPDAVRTSCGDGQLIRMGDEWGLQLNLCYLLDQGERRELSTVCSAELLEKTEREKMPSLILRRLQPDETLWDIAKQYQSSEELICAANILDDGDLPDGLLMIPKAR